MLRRFYDSGPRLYGLAVRDLRALAPVHLERRHGMHEAFQCFRTEGNEGEPVHKQL
ncbi:hypothetical protein D3C87_2123480 [compost metagenome]